MKTFIIIISLFISTNLVGQNIAECGIDDNPELSQNESIFLNDYLSDRKSGFDFTNKRIIFITGNSGNFIKGKSDYFQKIRDNIETDDSNIKIASRLIQLTDKQKLESGGYDAVICYWTKFVSKRRIKKIIEEIHSL